MKTRGSLLLAFVLTANLACQSSAPVAPLAPPARDDGAIVGGNAFDELPAVGSIALSNGRPWCTGTLIAPDVVLTAAHCFYDLESESLEFRIGPFNDAPRQRIAARQLVPHPSYRHRENNYRYDIGVMLLERDASAAPMRLIDSLDQSWVGRELFFVGYGFTDGITREGAGRKRAATIPITSVFSDRFRYENDNKNTCTGDSGGPAFWQSPNREWLVTGVVSHGDTPCLAWGVNTRVDVFLPFLEPYLPPDDPCGSVSFEGECDGNVLRWCENDRLSEVSCTERGLACGYDENNGFHDCVDPCGGETVVGRCDGQLLIWCEPGDEGELPEIRSHDCSGHARGCVFDDARGYYNCL